MQHPAHRAARNPREMDTFRPVAGNSLVALVTHVDGAPQPAAVEGPSRGTAWLMGVGGALVVVLVGAAAFMNAQRGVDPSSRSSAVSAPSAISAPAPVVAAAPLAVAAPAAAPTVTIDAVEDAPATSAKKKMIIKKVRPKATPATAAPATAPATTAAPKAAPPAAAPKAPAPTSASAAAKAKAQEDLIRASAETPIN